MSRFDYEFSELWSLLRKLSHDRLVELLSPFQSFLERIGIEPICGATDRYALCRSIWQGRQSMPPELDDALALITYVVATTWDEDLIWYCDRYGLEIEEEMVSEDLAVCAWLFDSSILHHIRNETQLDFSRTYSEYQGRDKDVESYDIDPEWVAAAEEELASWFMRNRSGDIAKIFEYERDGLTWFLIYHGRPIKRISCIQDGQPSIIQIRPDEVDKVVFDYKKRSLQINARDSRNKEQYRQLFGSYLFDDLHFFDDDESFSLDRLLEDISEALRCDDVTGIDHIRLTVLEFQMGEEGNTIRLTCKKDIEAMLKATNVLLLTNVSVVEAQFEVYFTGWNYKRSVTVKPPTDVRFKRDRRGRQIEQWLARRRLCALSS